MLILKRLCIFLFLFILTSINTGTTISPVLLYKEEDHRELFKLLFAEGSRSFKSEVFSHKDFLYACVIHSYNYAVGESANIIDIKYALNVGIPRYSLFQSDVYLDDLESALVLIGSSAIVLRSSLDLPFFVERQNCTTLSSARFHLEKQGNRLELTIQ